MTSCNVIELIVIIVVIMTIFIGCALDKLEHFYSLTHYWKDDTLETVMPTFYHCLISHGIAYSTAMINADVSSHERYYIFVSRPRSWAISIPFY